jgi:hypothetical protein
MSGMRRKIADYSGIYRLFRHPDFSTFSTAFRGETKAQIRTERWKSGHLEKSSFPQISTEITVFKFGTG